VIIIKYEKSILKYNSYKKWFKMNIFLFLISVIIYSYLRFFSEPTWLIVPAFMFILMAIGWGATALTGMVYNKK
jgi:membrane protein YdbS with pleckstrin-like domain